MTIAPDKHSQIITVFEQLQTAAYANAVEKGFWDTPSPEELAAAVLARRDEPNAPTTEYGRLVEAIVRARASAPRSLSEQIALQHSELSEVLEADRHSNPGSEKIPGFSSIEEEYADVLIRIFDTAERYNIRLGKAVLAKMEYNASRPKKHGKRY